MSRDPLAAPHVDREEARPSVSKRVGKQATDIAAREFLDGLLLPRLNPEVSAKRMRLVIRPFLVEELGLRIPVKPTSIHRAIHRPRNLPS